MTGSSSWSNSPNSGRPGASVARALIGVEDLDSLEGLVQQHLQVQRRVEQLTEQAAQYDVMPVVLPGLEAEARRLRERIRSSLEAWLERF